MHHDPSLRHSEVRLDEQATDGRSPRHERDGRILAEVETEVDARSVFDAWARDDGSIPGYVCLVETACIMAR
jgi:hypothetical protein